MNKKFTTPLLASLMLVGITAKAQYDCGTPRYQSEVFTAVTKTSDLIYGANPNGDAQLKVDFYEPQGDTLAVRPLIIWAHGGSFIGGTKADGDIVTFCNRFAKMGYACASISYTLGFDALPPDAPSAARTVYRTVHEMKAAIRYFRKDAATSNTFKIDPNRIIVGGSSAGAFIAMHTAYLDQYSELPTGIDTTGLNGLEGICGNPGYSSTPQIIINLCGALGDTAWMKNNNQPIASMHGTADAVVPYGADIITLYGFQIMPVDGSSIVHEQAVNLGITDAFKSWPGQGHVPYASNAAYMDSTVNFVRDFLYNTICSAVSVEEASANKVDAKLFPNPATDELNIQISPNAKANCYEVIDMNGKVQLKGRIQNGQESLMKINIQNLKNGIYSIRIKTDKDPVIKKFNVIK